ncbi:MAG: hypothetical protein CM15mP73_0820 [Hyphomicrobiales bacterium]|nr:MAG: hypothetical protein CM15mP73_0820 [Hyphomicrobiales bacterium]
MVVIASMMGVTVLGQPFLTAIKINIFGYLMDLNCWHSMFLIESVKHRKKDKKKAMAINDK